MISFSLLKNHILLFATLFLCLSAASPAAALNTVLFNEGIYLIPHPQQVSLGGVDTIICSPALTSHRHLSPQEKKNEGISDNLLRLSVGIEDRTAKPKCRFPG